MFTLDGIGTQFTLKWSGSDIVKENENDFSRWCETATDVLQGSIKRPLLYNTLISAVF